MWFPCFGEWPALTLRYRELSRLTKLLILYLVGGSWYLVELQSRVISPSSTMNVGEFNGISVCLQVPGIFSSFFCCVTAFCVM